MTVGTTLSRLTGFLRLTAMTATLGVTVSSLGSIYTVANLTPNIVYELILGGILTSVFVPVFVGPDGDEGTGGRPRGGESRDDARPRRRWSSIAALGALFAEQIIRLYLVSPSHPRAIAEAQVAARGLLPPMVHAADRLLRRRRRGDRAPAGAPPLRGPDVRPDPEQPGRDRDVRRVSRSSAATGRRAWSASRRPSRPCSRWARPSA